MFQRIALLVCVCALCASCSGGGGLSTRTTAPPILGTAPSVFPPPQDPWLDAPSLEALLANASDDVFSWSGYEAVSQVRRGESITITFNRAVAGELEIGRPLVRAPIELTPQIAGTATFVAPHMLTFTPDPGAFARGAEVRYRPSPSLRSRAGETLGETEPLMMVLDGTPRLTDHEGTISRGRPLRFYFDGPVSASALRTETLLYESGGGMRTIGFHARSLPRRNEGDYPVEISPTRALEPGMEVGFAMTPRWVGGGSRPGVRFVSVEPMPQLYVGQRTPGRSDEYDEYGEYDEHEEDTLAGATPRDALGVFTVGDALRIGSSHALTLPDRASFVFVPAVPSLEVALEEAGRMLVISADFEAGRTYTLRVHGVVTATGEPLAPVRMLSVRREPPLPSASWMRYGTTCETDAPCRLDFRAQNAARGAITWYEVERPKIAQALLSHGVGRVLRGGTIGDHLNGGSSAFREARGHITAIDAGAPGARVVRLMTEQTRPTEDAFVQRTDLATTVIALDATAVTWVTSLSHANVIEGAEVSIREGANDAFTGRTNAFGIVELPRAPEDPADTHGVIMTVASRGPDTSAIAVRAQTAVTTPEASRRVAMITDRGIYRPGERVRVVAFVRELTGSVGRVGTLGNARVRLVSGSTGETLADAPATASASGRYTATLDVPIHARRSACSVELVEVTTAQTVATASVRVATFDTPRSVVDVEAISPNAVGGVSFVATVAARQLVGTPLAGAPARVTLRRVGEASHDHAFSRFSFGDHNGSTFARTEHESRITLDGEGRARVELPFAPEIDTRTAYRADVVVQDTIGEETTASTGFVGLPASVEVGVAIEQGFISLGESLRVDVVAIDPAQAPLSGERVEVKLVERSGQTYYEQVRGPRGIVLAARHTDTERVAFTCTATTERGGLGHCRFTPTRAGTYGVEVSARDGQGHVSRATSDVYVAGPVDPSNDDAGRALRVRADRLTASGGEAIEVSFTSPFEDAEMLLAVTTSRLIHAERKRIGAGPQTVTVTATDAMAPGARISIVLAKPRTSPHAAPLDLGAPSTRRGFVDVDVRPAGTLLDVAFSRVPASVRTAETAEVGVMVKDANGHGVRSHLVVYAVDEAVLRLTSYAPPEPADTYFMRTRTDGYAIDDLRDHLIRPSLEALVATGAGDGGEGGDENAGDEPIPSREQYDPTLVFLADVETDANGNARVTLPAPGRATEFRLMAIAVDDALRSGVGTSRLRATSRVAMRPLFPLVLTTGDATSIEALVTNTSDAPVTVEAAFDIAGTVTRQSITLATRESKVVRQAYRAGEPGQVPMKLTVRGGGETLEHAAPVIVRGESVGVRRTIAGAFTGEHRISSTLPTDVSDGHLVLHVRRGRFVGHRTLLERIRNTYADADPSALAAHLHVLARLRQSEDVSFNDEERAYLGLACREGLERLLALRTPRGGFDVNGDQRDDLLTTAQVYLALREVTGVLAIPETTIAPLRVRVQSMSSRETSYVGLDANAQAILLAALADAGIRHDARIEAAYTQRSLLSRTAQARLARAFAEDDGRRATLIAGATEGLDFTPLHPVAYDLLLALRPLTATHDLLAAYEPRIDADIVALVESGADLGTPWFSDAMDVVAMLDARERDDADATVLLDGNVVAPARRTARAIEYRFDATRLAGAHAITIRTPTDATHTFELSGTYVQRTDPTRSIGRRSFVIRRLETLDGRPITGALPRSTAVRVRVFLVIEQGLGTFRVSVPDFGGVTARNERTTLEDELATILGAPLCEGVTDPRTAIAERTLMYVQERNVTGGANVFSFDGIDGGLYEVTYVVRTTAPGRFRAPPATISAGPLGETLARTGLDTLEVSE